MSQATGARLLGTFDPGTTASGTISFYVVGFSLNVEDRPAIDITSADHTVTRMVPGRRGNTTITINARFEDAQKAILDTDLLQCAAGTLAISAASTSDCGTVDILGTTETSGDPPVTTITGIGVYLMGYTVESTMDTSVDMTINFMLQTTGYALGASG